MKTIGWVLALAAFVAGVGLGFWWGRSGPPGGAGSGELAAAREQVRVLEERLAATAKPVVEPPALTAADSTQEAPSPAPAQGDAGESNPLSGFAQMMDNPLMREQIKLQMKGQIEGTYGKLLRDQSFAEDEVEALSALLLDRQMAVVEIAMKGMGASGPEREAMKDEFKEARAKYDEELKAVLGDEKFDELERFEQTQGERQQIESLKSSLASTDDALSADQEQRLMDVMWEVRESPEFAEGDGGEMAQVMRGEMFPDDTDALINGYTELQQEVLQRSEEFLSPAQLDALQKNQQGFLEMMKMGINMSKQFMGGGQGSKAQDGK